jgi:flagellar biosynthesis protein FlhF
MKIKHYRAPDMRHALRDIRESQGPEAVILSSRRIHGGVEVVAAIDYDPDIDSESFTTRNEDSAYTPKAKSGERASSRATHEELVTMAKRMAAAPVQEVRPDVNEELRSLRQMLETQLATLAWNDLSRRAPVQTELLKQLSMLGLAHDLAAELAAQLPDRLELAEAYRLALALMARRIQTSEERWLESGGIVAMVGPTGVGKTTLIAKLAARWVLRHGPREIVLISSDCVRIGASEQILTLGRLLGVPTHTVDNTAELGALLSDLGPRRFVLIDTAGLSQRDPNLSDELEALVASHQHLETCLVLSAAAQAGAIEEAVHYFAPAQPATCVLTKLDEATSLGGALSMLIRSQLPLAYVTDGQRVPEDVNAARAHQLIARAVELSRKAGATADEDLLRRRFGKVAHALA